MTNGWIDIKNTDMMLIMGGNPAENHPCGFKWAMEAKRNRNAKLISVDPRFTRTSATADLFVQIRAGSDIAFLGGVIRYAIENNRIAKEYLVNYTNAAFIVKEGFELPLDGLFSGFDSTAHTYDKSTWNYEQGGDMGGKSAAAVSAAHSAASHGDHPPAASSKSAHAGAPAAAVLLPPNTAYDLTLQHPRCVYQLLRQQYSRYTPGTVERITGIPAAQFLKAADLFTSIRKDGDMKKVATIIYAVGWTQHTFGTQIIRTAAMLQLMLGNVGRAGGGVNALRGHSNIQGATDMAGLYDSLPGYLKIPIPTDTDLATYLKRTTPTASKPAPWNSMNYWANTPKFFVSLMKAFYGDAATKQNDFAFDYLPKPDRDYSWTHIWDDMYYGKVKGLFAFGMNGVMIGPDTNKNINALKQADWLVVGEIYPDETSEFWRAPEITADEQRTIKTTVYRLPCAGFAEKDGSMTNSARWVTWKYAAVPPPGEARLDQDIVAQIFLRVRDLYKKEGGKFPDPILNVSWAYADASHPPLAQAAMELNGRALADVKDATGQVVVKAGQQLPGFALLQDDGTTMCGNWIYSGMWTEAGAQIQRRGTEDPSGLGIFPNWAWSWPANRRVLYNRASCDLEGKPWDSERKQIWWNEAAGTWAGNDVPDFKPDSNPKEHLGPFIMNPEGVGRLFAPIGVLVDGPFPEHYEPIESPTPNILHPQQSNNPLVTKFKTPYDKFGEPDEYAIVCTTYRLTEQYHYWTKNNPMNVELIPEPFIEIPVELADEKGIQPTDKIKVISARGTYIAKAFVTRRLKPMMIDGKKVYQIGLPIHQGFRGIIEDEGKDARTPANLLTPTVTDPNAHTPESKGFLVKVEKA
ncbi:MAG TPA: formate dehydrogenase-N subunit alpha [Candidatus Dormibacteraeota bacterium]|nr:formate dehydrogenase-N subunit alpha [Candidatus Dormibacteraeota bacterium]